ncbi:DUF453-domain-containing protein [Zopfia rhizophila CBS 207.26]|uniref:DUF453-domain-containing protein n=1 Tax=Zopfia rhizophila CBS 207.26 TaxID=1314779 RepID=A0A6A6EI88_9PEZI|nr:DUF453-domain-containing protein [Zopfia rhizophila CBS 207.26]
MGVIWVLREVSCRYVETQKKFGRDLEGLRPILQPHNPHRSIHQTAPHLKATQGATQKSLRAAYYRGGTSRALIFQPEDLPSVRSKWGPLFLQLMGSPDPYGRQLDGMGAGISSLSKICLVQRSKTPVSHVDYTFVGLGIEKDEVDMAGNCGNMSSAIGPYAYNAGLLDREQYEKGDGPVTVDILNTNTGKYIRSTFDAVGGQAAVQGDYAIDGVAGTGAKIQMDFKHPYGSKTGKLLPTGKKIDTLCGYRGTCIDGVNPIVFVRADEVGIDGTILPNDFNKLSEKLALLEKIRKAGAVLMGLAKSEDEVIRTIPKIGIVSMSSTHKVLSGKTINSASVDLVVRFISDTQPHRAIPLTAALSTAVAAKIEGSIVEQLVSPDLVDPNAVTIGHASGRIQVNATMNEKGLPESATVFRTALPPSLQDTTWSRI